MMLQTTRVDDTDLLVYLFVVFSELYLCNRIQEFVCMRYHTVAACPTDGYHMRRQAGRKGHIELGEV